VGYDISPEYVALAQQRFTAVVGSKNEA
jgi:hypothetical protein